MNSHWVSSFGEPVELPSEDDSVSEHFNPCPYQHNSSPDPVCLHRQYSVLNGSRYWVCVRYYVFTSPYRFGLVLVLLDSNFFGFN